MIVKFLSFISILLILSGIPHANAQEEPLTPERIVRVPSEKEQKKISKKFGPKFRVMESEHFRVISDCSFRYQQLVNGVLEQFYQGFHPCFFKKKMKRVTVYLIHGGYEYKGFVTSMGHIRNVDAYGFYVDKERAIYARHFFPDGKASGVGTLFHMAVHPMIADDFRKDPPAWFSAGLSSLCERGRIVKGEWIYGNPNPWRDTEYRSLFERGKSPDLQTLLSFSDNDFYDSNAKNVNTHASRSFFLYLLRKDEEQLARFVELIRRRKKGPKAAEEATGLNLEEIEKEWRESIITVNFAGDYAYRARGDKALEILKRGLENHPDDGYLHYRMAQALTDAAQNTKAVVHAKKALEDPRFIYPHWAYRIMGQAYSFGQASKAIEAFQQAISYQPWVDDLMEYSFNKAAYILNARKREEEAAAVLKKWERLQKENQR